MISTNLYTKELKRGRKNFITWTLIVLGMTLMVLSIFPYMADMGKQLSSVLSTMPDELKKALGLDEKTWTSILNFYSLYYGIYIVLLIGIYTTSTAATILSKEEKDRTAEFLYTQPLSRQTIFLSKFSVLMTLLALVYIIQSLVTILAIHFFAQDEVDWSVFFIMHGHGLMLILLFTAIGLLLPLFFKPKKNFMGIIVGIIFGSYFVDAISKTADSVSWLGYISPFHYFNFSISDPDYQFNWLASVIVIFICAGLIILTNKIYLKRDILG
ncbi:MAG: ABC transporter permease subunit [Putridiphycobacter sp.]